MKKANGAMNIPSIVCRRKSVNSCSLNKFGKSNACRERCQCVLSSREDFNVKSSYLGPLNCRSVCNNAIMLKDYIVERNFDIFAITET